MSKAALAGWVSFMGSTVLVGELATVSVIQATCVGAVVGLLVFWRTP